MRNPFEPIQPLSDKLRVKSGKRPSRAKASRSPQTSIKKVMSARNRKNSRVKGNTYELQIAEVFSNWSGEHVRRTPMSGGWSNARFGVTGDLVCVNTAFPFHVECKKREGWELHDLVTGFRKEHELSIVQWWKQTKRTCPKGKIPLLVFAKNRQPSLVLFRREDVESVWLNVYRPKLTTQYIENPAKPGKTFYIMTLMQFLENVFVPKGCRNYKEPRAGR